MKKASFLILLLAFLFSLGVRAPHIGRPLSAHHEYCTALVLIFLENWQDGGFSEHQGSPTFSFPGKADRYIHPVSYHFATREGALYYFSHMPLAYYLPHLFFEITGSRPNELALTWFNLVFHFITVLLLFLVMKQCFGQTAGRIPLHTALLYLFMPVSLWFHANVYMADLFVQNTWILHLLIAVLIFRRGRIPGRALLVAYGATLALMVFTNWLGVFVAAVGACIAIWYAHEQKDRRWWRIVMVSIPAVGLPILFVLWTYAQVVGIGNLFTYLEVRFRDRATMEFWTGGPLYHLRQLLDNYILGWLPVLFLIAGSGLVLLVLRWRGSQLRFPCGMRLFILLTLAPVLIDHSVFLKYAGHDFAVLKAGFFLAGLGAVLVDQAAQWTLLERRKALGPMAVLGTCLLGVLAFYRINPLPDGDRVRYDTQQQWGRTIASVASPDEVAFALGFDPQPQEQWYARRNLKPVNDVSEALAFLDARGIQRGVVFTAQNDVLTYERISLAGTVP